MFRAVAAVIAVGIAMIFPGCTTVKGTFPDFAQQAKSLPPIEITTDVVVFEDAPGSLPLVDVPRDLSLARYLNDRLRTVFDALRRYEQKPGQPNIVVPAMRDFAPDSKHFQLVVLVEGIQVSFAKSLAVAFGSALLTGGKAGVGVYAGLNMRAALINPETGEVIFVGGIPFNGWWTVGESYIGLQVKVFFGQLDHAIR